MVTPDGVLCTLSCNENRPFGLTIPLVVDDGRALQVERAARRITVRYPPAIEPAGDEQNFLLLDRAPAVHDGKPIQSAIGWLEPLRVSNDQGPVTVFVYPRSTDDPPAGEVLNSFKLTDDGFRSCLGRVAGKLYQGRTSAGGHDDRLDLDGDGQAELQFAGPCGFLVQLENGKPRAVETDRATTTRIESASISLESFVPRRLVPKPR